MNKRLLFSALLALSTSAFSIDRGPVDCSLTLLDAPFNTREKAWPSMNQSMELTKCFYAASHKAILVHADTYYEDVYWPKWLTVVGFDFFLSALPPGNTWLHEEWHRAVMSQRHISSYNGVYDFDLEASIIPVKHVDDADLIRLKKDHNADLVRLAEAGNEATFSLVTELEKREFFDRTDFILTSTYWFNVGQAVIYLSSGSWSESNEIKDIRSKEETDPKERDFVGHDFLSWVYDLHRPNEAYEARGAHPSGAGIQRYRSRADLTDEEKDFLKLQGKLTLLNFVDPFLFHHTRWQTCDQPGCLSWNANLRHHLTSFGYTIDSNWFFQWDDFDVFASLHNYRNGLRWFPGLEVELSRYALTPSLDLSVRGMVWEQPKHLVFRTRTGEFGGLVGTKLDYSLSSIWKTFVSVEGKSAGWVAGIPYQDKNLSSSTGVTWIW
jgi:hypothetical protein